MPALDADTLLKAYAIGVFPMAMSRDDPELHWFDPEKRGIIPLEAFHIPRRLARTLRAEPFRVTADTAFEQVMRLCAAPGPGRSETWINEQIVDLYTELHDRGHAHSVECWQDDEMAGGLYGVSLGAAFFGESMFSRRTDASKVALCGLVSVLKAGGYRLLDTQYLTGHLTQFGAVEISRRDYRRRLAEAIARPAQFHSRALSSSSIVSSMLG
ncbi:MAG: leucyl/phenylalanyl-tRNA--protein transferase [Alphaproteobacteria bacterium]|nr:leucyl/phenylalanyl-tRNA--protein transferase [Alphaproteobacteria bacterium]